MQITRTRIDKTRNCSFYHNRNNLLQITKSRLGSSSTSKSTDEEPVTNIDMAGKDGKTGKKGKPGFINKVITSFTNWTFLRKNDDSNRNLNTGKRCAINRTMYAIKAKSNTIINSNRRSSSLSDAPLPDVINVKHK